MTPCRCFGMFLQVLSECLLKYTLKVSNYRAGVQRRTCLAWMRPWFNPSHAQHFRLLASCHVSIRMVRTGLGVCLLWVSPKIDTFWRIKPNFYSIFVCMSAYVCECIYMYVHPGIHIPTHICSYLLAFCLECSNLLYYFDKELYVQVAYKIKLKL